MWKLYENFHIFHFQKRIVSAETIRGNTVIKSQQVRGNDITHSLSTFCPLEIVLCIIVRVSKVVAHHNDLLTQWRYV